MTSKLTGSRAPSEVMVIRRITPAIIALSSPFWRFGKIKVGGRGTIVRLQSGGLAVFSPVALTPEVRETVTEMGEVKYLAALDMEHHIYLGPWHEAYPQAKVLGPEGLAEKRAKQENEKVPFAVTFSAKNKASIKVDAAFDTEFEYEFVDGHANKELVFLHKPSRTLIEADLMFNLPATEQFSRTDDSPTSGVLTKAFTYFNNTRGAAMGQKRFIWYAISSGDRASFNKSVGRIGSWDFDRVIPCHGDVIESGGKGVFETVMEWHLKAGAKDGGKTD